MADIRVVVMVIVMMILGEGNSTREKNCSERGKSKSFANVIHETSCSFDVTPDEQRCVC
jgi:hypothetical protein